MKAGKKGKIATPKRVQKKPARKLGILDGKGKIEFVPDFKISEKEFLGL